MTDVRTPWQAGTRPPPAAFMLDDRRFDLDARMWHTALWHIIESGWERPFLLELVGDTAMQRIDDRLTDLRDDFTMDDVRYVARDLVEKVCGCRWWTAQRLYATLAASWRDVSGTLTLAGSDISRVITRPWQVCDMMQAWILRGLDQSARTAMIARIEMPPPDVDLESAPLWTPQAEAGAFEAALAAHKRS